MVVDVDHVDAEVALRERVHHGDLLEHLEKAAHAVGLHHHVDEELLHPLEVVGERPRPADLADDGDPAFVLGQQDLRISLKMPGWSYVQESGG